MSWISEANLVAAVSEAGGFGVLASGAMDADTLRKEVKATKSKTKKNFGVNIITLSPHIDGLVDVCIEENVRYIIFAGGIVHVSFIDKLLKHSIKVLTFAPNESLAKRMINNGVDALIIEGSEAGGHIGAVSTSVLAQEILPKITQVPVFVAGGIGRGEMMRQYLELGASGIQIGTMLVCSTECIAHDNFKKIFIKSNSRDAKVTIQIDPDFPIIPVRALANKGSTDFMRYQHDVITEYKLGSLSKHDAQMKIEYFWAGALRKAVIEGDVEHGSLMAGQAVGFVNEVLSVKDIIERLMVQSSLLK